MGGKMGAPSSRAGMGATPYGEGTTFRVWAPGVAGVAVTGPFTRWPGTPLASQPAGMWSADVPGAVPGQAYQVLLMTGAGTLTRVDPYARQVVNENGLATHAVIYDEGAFDWGDLSWSSPGWTELVIYELHVGSFSERPGETVGNLADVARKLPYLQELGVNAVELLPLATFEGAVSWGYDPGVPFSAERAYGGPDGLKAFVRAAHGLGIAVILNVVYNHFGPADSVLWQFDGSGPTWEGGIYFYGARYPGDPRPQTPWGSRPDYGRAEVRQYLVDNAVSWLRDYRLDGLRLDATAYIRNIFGDGDPSRDIPDGWQLLQQINDAIDGSQPWKITIAEDMQDNDWITRSTAAQGAGFDAQWDPHFVQQVRAVLEQDQDADRDMRAIQAALEQRYAASAYVRVVFTESHDADGNGRTRVPTEIDLLRKRTAKAAPQTPKATTARPQKVHVRLQHVLADNGALVRDGACLIMPVAGEALAGGRSRSRGPPARRQSDEHGGGGARRHGCGRRGCGRRGGEARAAVPRDAPGLRPPGVARLRCPGEQNGA